MPLTIEETHGTNTLLMPITEYHVKQDGLTLGTFRDKKYADLFKNAVDRDQCAAEDYHAARRAAER